MNAERIKVKRDGPRGWHWIAASSFDPARHERIEDQPAVSPTSPAPTATTPTPPAKRKRGAA